MAETNLLSRIAYTSVYFLLCFLLAALLLVVPGDFIRQVLLYSNQYINLIVTAIVFVITVIIVGFVYALRLYITRTVIASIPRTRIPIEKGDVTKEVRKMIANDLSRTAAIAWEAHPRVIASPSRGSSLEDVAEETVVTNSDAKEPRKSLQLFRPKPRATAEQEMGISLPPVRPVWGEVEHDGWGSPSSPDLPNLQYATVLSELPNLIEAKAVSQSPPDPDSTTNPPALDAEAVALLQRSHNMTMRDYVVHLMSVGVLPSSKRAFEFLDSYERARFSPRPLSDAHFRQLMRLFAELLRAMQPLDSSLLYGPEYPDDAYFESDGHVDDDGPRDTAPTTPTRSESSSVSVRSKGSTGSRRRRQDIPARKLSTKTWHQYQTAPTTPRSKYGTGGISRSLSARSSGSFTRTGRLYPTSKASSSSLRSISQASVIRLATREDRGDLPYVLRIGDNF
ncbi:hypothetical protein GGS23DRAFT_599517 [Durotheca rogersii]|uniref:uncharacterized protein n=1 Tax=Durotheca rogersii TaxID=419775 RepID=UPI0022200C9B|nr:uncharacterized protein GGS23DRAFT_599517 [Durotheca rogersii]KAI5860417.1 hypothetical protein GGS23DRAFT_599517 [Durotheca rogersii]